MSGALLALSAERNEQKRLFCSLKRDGIFWRNIPCTIASKVVYIKVNCEKSVRGSQRYLMGKGSRTNEARVYLFTALRLLLIYQNYKLNCTRTQLIVSESTKTQRPKCKGTNLITELLTLLSHRKSLDEIVLVFVIHPSR